MLDQPYCKLDDHPPSWNFWSKTQFVHRHVFTQRITGREPNRTDILNFFSFIFTQVESQNNRLYTMNCFEANVAGWTTAKLFWTTCSNKEPIKLVMGSWFEHVAKLISVIFEKENSIYDKNCLRSWISLTTILRFKLTILLDNFLFAIISIGICFCSQTP